MQALPIIGDANPMADAIWCGKFIHMGRFPRPIGFFQDQACIN